MRERNVFIIAAALGIVWGIISSRLLFVGSWASLIPWSVTAFLIGLESRTWKHTLANEAGYGFFLGVAFIIAGYSGPDAADRLRGVFILAFIIGLAGIACAIVIGLIGNLLRKRSE